MRLIATMPCRNEAHVLGLSARAALRWVDELMILVHASTDGTGQIASGLSQEFPERVWVAFDDDPLWREMEHRQNLLTGARQRGATHIAIIDADEILTGNLLVTVREQVRVLRPGQILQLPGYNLRGSLNRYHANGIWGGRLFSVAFRDDRKAYWAGDCFHHREPAGIENNPCRPVSHGQGGILHLWGADEGRLIAKHRYYKMTERLRWPGKPAADIDRLYNLAIKDPGDWRYAEVPSEWWEPYADLMPYLNLEAEPWQSEYCQALVARDLPKFSGLDLFGLS